MPNHPSQRRKQRRVICLASDLVFCEGMSGPPDLTTLPSKKLSGAESTLHMSETMKRLTTSSTMIFLSRRWFQVKKNQVAMAMLGPTTAATTPQIAPKLLPAVTVCML